MPKIAAQPLQGQDGSQIRFKRESKLEVKNLISGFLASRVTFKSAPERPAQNFNEQQQFNFALNPSANHKLNKETDQAILVESEKVVMSHSQEDHNPK